MARSMEGLSSEQRIAHYRNMSAEALRQSQTAENQETKAGFIDNASSWLALANEVEHLAGRLADTSVVRRKSRADSPQK